MKSYFFVSYAGKEDRRWVQRFHADLEYELRLLVGPAVGGILDTRPRPGMDADLALAAGAGRIRSMVALCSDPFFKDAWCGREWEVFGARVENFSKAGATRLEDGFLRVLWRPNHDPVPPSARTALTDAQIGLPEIYGQHGLLWLMRYKLRGPSGYYAFVRLFAARIIAAQQIDLDSLPELAIRAAGAAFGSHGLDGTEHASIAAPAAPDRRPPGGAAVRPAGPGSFSPAAGRSRGSRSAPGLDENAEPNGVALNGVAPNGVERNGVDGSDRGRGTAGRRGTGRRGTGRGGTGRGDTGRGDTGRGDTGPGGVGRDEAAVQSQTGPGLASAEGERGVEEFVTAPLAAPVDPPSAPRRIALSYVGADQQWADWLEQLLRRGCHEVRQVRWAHSRGERLAETVDHIAAWDPQVTVVLLSRHYRAPRPEHPGTTETEAWERLGMKGPLAGRVVRVTIDPQPLPEPLRTLRTLDLSGLEPAAVNELLMEVQAGGAW
ncbi:toll/interleukin-1 receptor domain-containing protein [Frankia gtarii]|uniref:toll/interleukin-1 receptor domain-containing protein n=1 Tax=Frankia gtarii TaxID=2950102 RepID=UPI0021C16B87|nr:toll/interleukin-1 receptor domain-containing protein [Frankia gtarii]